MKPILIVDDEAAIAELIRRTLAGAGYACQAVTSGAEAADLLEQNQYDLVLLDVMMPGIDGYDLLRWLRPGGMPVVFITAKGTTADKVKGLRLGADDYLVKPFEIVELLARVEAVLRRAGKSATEISIEGLTIDTRSHTVMRGSRQIPLTAKEFELLLLFVRNRNIALFRETIYERVWGSEYMGDSRTVDLHVQRLRKKLHWDDKIKTIYKVGYRLEI